MPAITFDAKNYILLVVGAVNLIYGLIVYLRNRKSRINFWFFGVVLAVTFWIFSMIFYRGSQGAEIVVLWARVLYFSATFIPFFFLYFTFLFPEEESYLKNWQRYLLPIPSLSIAILALLPNVLIKGVDVSQGAEKEIMFNQNLHLLYGIYITGFFGWSYINLFRKYLASIDIVRTQLMYVIVGTFLSTTIGVSSNLIMPLLGNFNLNWLGQATVVFMIVAISYAILKHRLFNIRVIATELLVFIIWIFVLIRLLLSDSFQERMINGGFLVLLIFFGVLLISSVWQEVRQKEEIKKLSAYKSELLSIVSHQIKNPLAIVKGYASLINDKTISDPAAVEETAKKIKAAADKLLKILNNLLDFHHIEEGKMHYEFQKLELNDLLKNVVNDFQVVAKQKGLDFVFEPAPSEIYVNADIYKLSQVFQNLIDNSIKYTDNGWVKVKIEPAKPGADASVLITVSDSGRGMSQDLSGRLFEKFQRGVKEKEILGTGLGLYICKEIVQAHQGAVWAESEGKGKGSKFFVRLKTIA